MSNIFVDRTRSQAAYGLQMHKKKSFLNSQESWESRANKTDNMKGYNSNVELQPTKGFAWGNDQAVRELPYTSNVEKSHNWKQYNSYETQDHLNKTKDMLKNEINNIALRIVKARDAKQNMSFNHDANMLEGNWKVPEIEAMNRNFNESTRYYNCFPYQRKHGTKYVPPPKAEHIQQLRDEMAINETQHPNYLKNFLYHKDKRSMSQANKLDRFDELQQEVEDAEPVDQVMHAMKNSKYNTRGGHYNQTQPLFHKRGKSSYNIQRDTTTASLNKLRDSFTNNAIQNDNESMKSAQRVLKLAHKAGAAFQFPKRERFNEQVDDEIKSQREEANERLNSAQSLKRKLIKNNLNTVDERSVRSGSQNGSRVTGHSRTLSKKSITKSELSRFFKRNRNPNAPETQVAFSRVNFKTSASASGSHHNKTVSHGYRQKFFRKLDCGNPRYAADKPESQMGLLCGQRTRPDGFAEPTKSEIDAHERRLSQTVNQTEKEIDTKDTLEGKDVLVRDQNKFYKEPQVNNDAEEDRLTVDKLKTLDEKNIVHENPDVDQITFNDVESLEEQHQTQGIENKISTTISNGGGAHRLASWGTGYQSGMPLSYYRTPEAVQSKQVFKNQRQLQEDQVTVASTQIDQLSNVSAAPTSVISRECNKITQKLQEQLQTRLRLEKEVRELQRQAEKTKKFIAMQGNDDNALKLLVTDQRNLMYSGQNYMRHPQVEDL